MTRIGVFGPIGIAIGIYVDLMAITWILEERDAGKKLFHVKDIYTHFAAGGSQNSEGERKWFLLAYSLWQSLTGTQPQADYFHCIISNFLSLGYNASHTSRKSKRLIL